MTVRVVLPLPLDQAYTYRVPEALDGEARAGCRVVVPFGPRRLTGVVVGEGEPPERLDFALKDVHDVLDDEPALTPALLRLTRWMADYYCCGWGEVIKAALPAGTGVKTERRLFRTSEPLSKWHGNGTGEALLRYVDARGGEATWRAARRSIEGTATLADARRLEAAGLIRIETGLSEAQVSAKEEWHLRFAPAFRHDGAARDLKEQLRGAKQRALVEALAGFRAEGTPEPREADVRARSAAPLSTVKSLVEKGLIERIEKEVRRSLLANLPAPPQPPERTLHPAQKNALEKLCAAIERGSYAAFLLHGVTGSGKTEVYIAALKAVLSQGKTGIILVPEIALTPQTVQRFRAHFPGGQVAVLHSQMSLGERFDTWRSLREGRFRIAIGPRSAVLAPLENLGLVVVDEEHEQSYKQFDPAPRYHARDVAVMRAHQSGAVCVLGSATPSLESLANARRGKYVLLEMPERVPVPGHAAAPLPDVRIVDLTKERQKHRLDGALSVPLKEAIQERLERGEQTILLHNRRGFAVVIECAGCGFAPTCPDCSVTLTYHKAHGHLRCHYCGRTRRLPRNCPQCDEDGALEQLGTGTQRVEEELAAAFPEARLLRMDRDTTGRKGAHRRILNTFGAGQADILLGTQMIAKGLDFGRVTLVGVVNADVGLLLPDFRAEERIFQLLTQVAGRAGRAGLRGEVFLQTRNPEHAAIQHAARHDYDGFARAALQDRRALGYPPFGRVVGVEFRGPEEAQVEKMATAWTRHLLRFGEQVEVLGPEPALIGRIKKQYRYHTILRAPLGVPPAALQAVLRQTEDAFGSAPRGYRIAVDVDAMSLF